MRVLLDHRSKSNNLNKSVTSLTKIVPPVIAIAVFLVIWQLLCMGKNPNLPSPITTLKETWNPLIISPFFDHGGTDKGLGLQTLASLERVAIGFSLSAIVGITLGILVGSNAFIYRAVDPMLQVLSTVPPLAWLPVSLAGFRQATTSAIFVIFITAIWPITINTMVGVQQIPQDYRNVAKLLQLSGFKYFYKIMLPSTGPYIFKGLRIGIGLSWLAIVAAEMLTGGVGIGCFIWNAYKSSRLSETILALIYVGVVGLMLDRLVGFLALKVVPFEQKQ